MKDKKITKMLFISLPLAVVSAVGLILYENYAKNLKIATDFILIELMAITAIHAICVLAVFFCTKHSIRPDVRAKNTVNSRYARTEKVFNPYKAYGFSALVIGAMLTVSSVIMLFCGTDIVALVGYYMIVFGIPSVLLLLLLDYIAKKVRI